jgi:hypothetical protein
MIIIPQNLLKNQLLKAGFGGSVGLNSRLFSDFIPNENQKTRNKIRYKNKK